MDSDQAHTPSEYGGADLPEPWTAQERLQDRLERAAIMEFDGGLPREQAELLAGLTALRASTSG